MSGDITYAERVGAEIQQLYWWYWELLQNAPQENVQLLLHFLQVLRLEAAEEAQYLTGRQEGRVHAMGIY